jgi:hypothetical protein
MRAWNLAKMSGVVAAATLFVAAQAQAIIAFNFPQLNANQNYSGSLSLGELFTVNSAVNINKVAAYGNPVNGSGIFGGGVEVAIYQVSLSGNSIIGGTLVVNPLTFSTANPGTLIAGTTTREPALSSAVQLGAGTYMIVANHYGGGAGTENNWNRSAYGGSPVPTANTGGGLVSYGPNYYSFGNLTWASSLPTGSWVYDNVNNPANDWHPRYMAGNFDFAPVPEAATFGAAAVGLLGLVYVARYVRIRRRMQVA